MIYFSSLFVSIGVYWVENSFTTIVNSMPAFYNKNSTLTIVPGITAKTGQYKILICPEKYVTFNEIIFLDEFSDRDMSILINDILPNIRKLTNDELLIRDIIE